MVAQIGGQQVTAWELPDGQWGAATGTPNYRRPEATYADWPTARRSIEGSRQQNPLDPLIAAAAASGAALAMRNALVSNPARPGEVAVMAIVPRDWVRRVKQDSTGVTLHVAPGKARRAHRALVRSRCTSPVRIIEVRE
jgi:hypothetical protein